MWCATERQSGGGCSASLQPCRVSSHANIHGLIPKSPSIKLLRRLDNSFLTDDMAPSGKEIEKALLKSINEAWQNEREQITVKFIRSKVEKVLNLKDGFFKEDEDWKAKSKSIITDEFVS